jgi:hypothetical protein
MRGTGDWGTDERPKNFREFILWADPNGSAPLTALLSKMKKESTDDPEFAWFEEELKAIRVKNTAGTLPANVASTTLELDATTAGGLNLVAGDILMVEKTETATYDNEILLVSSVTNDTTVIVKRAQSGSSVATIGSGAFLTKIGSAYEEGTGAPAASTRNPTKFKNFTQIFKTTVDMTNTAKATRLRTGDSWANDKKRKAFDHAVMMEFAFMFGQAFEETGPGGKPRRFTGGLRDLLTTNLPSGLTVSDTAKIYTTTPTEEDFLDTIHSVFDFNAGGAGSQRLVFAGNGALNTLNKIRLASASTQIVYDGVIKFFGMSLQRWITPQGEFFFRTHPLMNTHGKFKDSMFIINPAGIRYRPLKDRDTKFEDNIQNNDEDRRKGQWKTEAGLEINHVRTFKYIGNFTKP